MALSPGQLNAIDVVERIAAALSLVGTLFIIGTFLFSHEYRKPANRLIFHAAWGNIMSCVTCTIAMSGPHQGEDSALCQAQGFFMQWSVNLLSFLICASSDRWLAGSIGLCGRMFSGDYASPSMCGLRSSGDTAILGYKN